MLRSNIAKLAFYCDSIKSTRNHNYLTKKVGIRIVYTFPYTHKNLRGSSFFFFYPSRGLGRPQKSIRNNTSITLQDRYIKVGKDSTSVVSFF